MKKLSKVAQAANAIKAELKTVFPAIKFSVTSSNFSMGDAVRVSYTDGVPTKEVEAIVRKYQYGKFNSMEDMYENTNRRDDIPQSKWVQVSRDMSEAAKDELLQFVQATYSGAGNLGYGDFCPDHGDYMSVLVRRLFSEKSYVPAADQAAPETPAANDLQIIPYSDRSFVVFGDTRPIKDGLKELGGKFNGHLTHPDTKDRLVGWIFSIKQLGKVKKFLGK